MDIRILYRICSLMLLGGFVYQVLSYHSVYVICIILFFVSYRLFEHKFVQFVPVDHTKAVLITGCDTGFGHYLAKRLANKGLTVFAGVFNENSEGANELRNRKRQNLHVIQLDVTDSKQIQKAVESVKKVGKGLWAVVNNAGMDFPGEVEMIELEQYQKCANINLWGQVRIIKAFLPFIRKSKGRIVNVSSVRGRCAWPGGSAYHITKYGIETMSDCLRIEMAKFDVNVSIIEPGAFGAATAVGSTAMCERIKKEVDVMWEKADQEVKDLYGKNYFYSYYEEAYLPVASLPRQPALAETCVDAMEDAVLNVNPKTRYMVDGPYKICDPYTVIARYYNYLPTFISDPICYWYLGVSAQIEGYKKLQ